MQCPRSWHITSPVCWHRCSGPTSTVSMASDWDAASIEPSDEWVQAVRAHLLAWGPTHFQPYPWRGRIRLWQALIVEVMLQRTRAAQVVPVFTQFRARYPTIRALRAASNAELREVFAPLGLRWRIELLVQLVQELVDRHGRIPMSPAALRTLPGVGDYAAAATLSLHADRDAVLIDSNIVRMLSRLLGRSHDGETRRQPGLRALAARLTPTDHARVYGYAVLDLSMTVCRSRVPLCDSCPLRSLCAYVAHGRHDS